MPYIDKRTGEIVLRVIYDGPPEAGKTTNIQRLAQRVSMNHRGPSLGQDNQEEGTGHLDWLDFSGGYIHGKPVRCQIASVPGQSALLRRRKHLLQAADAVIFVADSTPAEVASARLSYRLLQKALLRNANDFAVPIVIQANKQDCPGALEASALQSELGAAVEVPVFPAEAHLASGVLQTFLKAVQLATERVHSLIIEGELQKASANAESPEALFDAMKATQEMLASYDSLPPDAPTPALPAKPAVAQAADSAKPSGEATIEPPPSEDAPKQIPTVESVPAGCFWPPEHGRAILTEVCGMRSRRMPTSPWAPSGAFQFRAHDRWVLQTCSGWRFDKQEAARSQFTKLITPYAKGIRHAPKGRAFLVAREATAWRIWMISPDIETLAQRLEMVVSSADCSGTVFALEATMMAVAQFGKRTKGKEAFPGLQHIAVVEGDACQLSLPGFPMEAPYSQQDATTELRELVTSIVQGDPERTACFQEAVAITKERKGQSEP